MESLLASPPAILGAGIVNRVGGMLTLEFPKEA